MKSFDKNVLNNNKAVSAAGDKKDEMKDSHDRNRKSLGPFQRLYDMLHRKSAMGAFGGVSFLESSILPVPIDLFMIPMLLANRDRFWFLVLVGAMGSVLGAMAGYMIGYAFYETLGQWIIKASGMHTDIDTFRSLYDEYGVWVVVIAGITPLPFKLAAILSGLAGMNFGVFIITAFLIRFFRFSMIGGMLLLFAPLIMGLYNKSPKGFVIVMVCIMLGGFVLLPFLDVEGFVASRGL